MCIKKMLVRAVAVSVLALVLAFNTGCGGGGGISNDPKVLARQAAELTSEMLTLALSGKDNDSKTAALNKKLGAITAKVEKMSEADQLIYATEFLKFLEE